MSLFFLIAMTAFWGREKRSESGLQTEAEADFGCALLGTKAKMRKAV